MSDYIKRDGVMMVLGQSKTLTDGMRSVLMIPRADVVEVVRCKDCIHNDQCKHRVVMWVESPMNTWHKDIDYCSFGERKEQEHE